MGLNFSVLVVLCDLPIESCIQAEPQGWQLQCIAPVPWCPVPSAKLGRICAKEWDEYERNFLEGGGNVCFSLVSN